MKNIVLIFCSLFLSQIYGQRFSFGLALGGSFNSFGINTNNISSEKDLDIVSSNYQSFTDFNKIDVSGQLGFHSNFLIKFSLSDRFGFYLEPGISKRGGVIYASKKNDENKHQLNLYYASLPSMFYCRMNEKLQALIGGEFEFIITEEFISPNGVFWVADNSGLLSNPNVFNKVDIGINVGFSYSIIDRLHLELRLHKGFIPSYGIRFINFTSTDWLQSQKSRLTNQGISLILKYDFGRH